MMLPVPVSTEAAPDRMGGLITFKSEVNRETVSWEGHELRFPKWYPIG